MVTDPTARVAEILSGGSDITAEVPVEEFARLSAQAAGHEHVLQVIESPQWGRVLVSGTGIFGHTSPVKDVPGSLYHASRAGYMRIDWLRDGTRRLGVIEVAKDGSFHESFAKRLDDAPIGR